MFQIDQIYKRTDLHDKYDGQRYGGISTPANHTIIMLFAGENGEQYGYSDGWSEEKGVYLYTGEGQIGDMAFKGGNTAIRDHMKTGKDIHLFEYIKTGYVKYVGQMVFVSFKYRFAPDQNKNIRKIIVFELKPI